MDTRDVIEAAGLLLVLGVLVIVGNNVVQNLSRRVRRLSQV